METEIRMMRFRFCIPQHPVAILRLTQPSWMLLAFSQEMRTVLSRQMKMAK